MLWEFCNNTSVDLQLGTHAWSQKLGRGLLQGTSFSADVFSRVLDFFLSPLLNTWKQTAHKTFSRFDLPHLLLFADDILVLGSSAAELQAKLHDLQHCRSVIGLHINFAKCSVLHNEDGGCPGVWPYKWCSPLQGCNDLVYLGVPLSHKQTPLGQLGVSLARVSSSFFALRKLFDHPSTPVVTKLDPRLATSNHSSILQLICSRQKTGSQKRRIRLYSQKVAKGLVPYLPILPLPFH